MVQVAYSVRDAAEILSAYEVSQGRKPVNIQRVYYLIRMGRLESVKFGLKKRGRNALVRVFLDLPDSWLRKVA